VTTTESTYFSSKLTPATCQRPKSDMCPRLKTLCSRRKFFINGIRLWNHLPHQYKTI